MNKALTSNLEFQDHLVPLRKAQYALLVNSLSIAGYEADRYLMLKPACHPSNQRELEDRKSEWVEYYLTALALTMSLSSLPDVTSCLLYDGENSIEDSPSSAIGGKALLATSLAGSNNDLIITALSRGSLGNILQVQYVDPAANNQALAVTLVGNLIRVSLATGAGGAITSTASLVMAAINNSVTASTVVTASLAFGNTGAGVVIAMAATNLAGGSDRQ